MTSLGALRWRPATPPPPAPCSAGEHDPCATLQLADGRRLQVRPLQADDAAAEQAFFSGLSHASRYRRFHLGIPTLPPSLLTRMVDVDQQRHVALAARPLGQPHIVADARYVRDDDDSPQGPGAEFAVAVADDWQGLGLARQLLARLARHARSQGVTHLHGDVLWDNPPMLALAQRLGGRVQAVPGEPGLLRVSFSVTAPTSV